MRLKVAAFAVIVAGTTLVATQQPVPPRPQQQPVFRGGANLVQVDVYPTRDGKIVEGLTPADFQVFEDGRPQAVDGFEFIRIEPNTPDAFRRDPNTQEEGNQLAQDPRNRVFVVYLDYYHMNLVGSHSTRRPLVDFLNRMLSANDLFGVTTPMLRPRDLILGRRTETLEEQLAKYWTWGWTGLTVEPEEEALAFKCMPVVLPMGRRRMDLILSNLDGLVSYLGNLREARKVVVLLTRGWTLPDDNNTAANATAKNPGIPQIGVDPRGRLTTEPDPARGQSGSTSWCSGERYRLLSIDFQQRLRDLIQSANRNNVTFYPVNPAGLETLDAFDASRRGVPSADAVFASADRLRDRIDSMMTLGENTDGFAVVNTNDLGAGLRRISDDVSAYYVLGYYSTNSKFDGKFRRIEVKMRPPGLRVKARRGYFSPPENTVPGVPTARPGVAVPAATKSSAVDDALGALSRLRPTAELYTRGTAAGTELVLATEIPTGQLIGGHWAKGADVEFVVSDGAGATVATEKSRIDAGARSTLVRVAIAAEVSGPWRVIARATAGGDTLQDRIEVTRPSSKVIGDVLVFRGAPGGQAVLRPVGDMQYRRTERVHLEWPILAPLDRREGRLLGRNGLPIAVPVTLTEREVSGRQVLTAVVNLAPLTEADYVIEVAAGAGSESERRLIAIRVVR